MPDYTDEIRPIDVLYQDTDDNSPRIEAIQIGPINKSAIPFIPNHNPHQMLQGFHKRVAHQQKIPNREKLARFYDFVGRQIIKLQPLPPLEHGEALLEEWLKDYGHNEGRKRQIRNAFARRDRLQLTSKDYRCKMFVKREFYADYKYARMINPRSDEFVAQVGPYIHKIDEYLFHESPFKDWFIKGMNPTEQIEAMSKKFEGGSIFIETDYSSFEGSYTVEYQQKVEWALLRHMLKNNPDVIKVIAPCYKSKGPNNHIYNPFIGAKFSGSRMSGDLWTSSMNGFSNLMNMLFLAQEHGTSVVGFVEGDDGLFSVNNHDITPADYDDLGFTIKLDYQSDISDCAFCQKIFHPETHTLIAPPQVINKSGWTAAKAYFKTPAYVKEELYQAVCMSYLSLFPRCPIVSTFFRCQLASLKLTRRKKENLRFDDKWWSDMFYTKQDYKFLTEQPIDYRDRLLYEKRFGIPVDQQLSLEKWFREHPGMDFEIDFDCPSYAEGLTETVDTQT